MSIRKSFLIRKARRLLDRGLPLPLDLFAALIDLGVDVSELSFSRA
jgi:hypothetical protein